MGADWLRNPRHVFPIVGVVALVLVITAWSIQRTDPALDLSVLYNLALALFTASLAASITLWVYSFLSYESQKREWRHDLEVRHFEEVYGPLYEETKQVVAQLRQYGQALLPKWREIHESSFGPFVEEGISQGLSDLEAKLDKYSEVVNLSVTAAQSCVKEFLEHHPRTASLNQHDRESLWSTLRDDPPFLFDPAKRLPHAARVEHVAKQLPRTEGTEVTEKEAEKFLHGVKTNLLEHPAIKKRIAECQKLLPEAERVHGLVSRRMRDPFT